MKIPYEPLRLDKDSLPVYSNRDLELYGEPVHYGVKEYTVIETDRTYTLDYHKCTSRKILPYHHYCREERFRVILGFLLGKGRVPFEIFELVMDKIESGEEEFVWYEIQDILGKSGNCRYVNRIPKIMIMLGYGNCFETTRQDFIIERFNRASERFDYLKSHNLLGCRTYFPNLRYVALRLLAEHKANFKVKVPLLKTKSKLKPMNVLYNKLFI